MGLINPLALCNILLPSLSHLLERCHLIVRVASEEVSIVRDLENPVKVLASDIRDELRLSSIQSALNNNYAWRRSAHPGKSLSVEADLLADSTRDQEVGIDHVAVQLESGVIEDKIDSSIFHLGNNIPKCVHVVSENVGLGGSEVLSSGRLESLDVLLRHVDQQREIGRVSPQADCERQRIVSGYYAIVRRVVCSP